MMNTRKQASKSAMNTDDNHAVTEKKQLSKNISKKVAVAPKQAHPVTKGA
jgi:hypothetical protein